VGTKQDQNHQEMEQSIQRSVMQESAFTKCVMVSVRKSACQG